MVKSGTSAHTPVRLADASLFTDAFQVVVSRFKSHGAAAKALGISRTRVVRLAKGEVGGWVRAGLVKAMRSQLRGDTATLVRLDDAILSPRAREAFTRYAGWLNVSVRHNADVREVFTALRKLGYESYLTAFREKHRLYDDPRTRLAILRALEPLAVAYVSGGIELSLAELAEAGKLGTYLNAALKREEILLQRTPDRVRRAQEVTGPKIKQGPR